MKYLRILLAALAACLLCMLSFSAGGQAFSNPPIDEEVPTSPVFPPLIGLSPVKLVVHTAQVTALRRDITWQRQKTWEWQDMALVPRTKTSYGEKKNPALGYLKWMVNRWTQRRLKAKQYALHPPHLAEFLCIRSGIQGGRWSLPNLDYLGGGYHVKGRGEGAWTTNTGNGFYGGVQMNLRFILTYGSSLFKKKGTADNWKPLEQIWVAEKAVQSRGFRPWPNTARACGLI